MLSFIPEYVDHSFMAQISCCLGSHSLISWGWEHGGELLSPSKVVWSQNEQLLEEQLQNR